MRNNITKFADEADLQQVGSLYGDSEPVLATIITTTITATTATTATTAAGYHNSRSDEVMAGIDEDAPVSEMLAARKDAMLV
ncbi:hypothetical protein [Auritidibacter ignavus]|uniref:hypothetical protein n=1 Tax=Auritidibacter ignavus TaxID=678932 RepID=UPI0024486CA7|nr:hypothetical protein [Auritidibacter ignavus]WGH83611.1 hypothetical protein QDX20_10135 [Auritidibacter ignavus]